MGNSEIWFSHRENRYDAELKENQRVFHWRGETEIWDWDNCSVSSVKTQSERLRVVIRSTNEVFSRYKRQNVELRYMLGFDVSNISKPKPENYHEPPSDNLSDKKYGQERLRWVIQLDDDYWIWQWAKEGIGIENSEIYSIYQMLKKTQSNQYIEKNVFSVLTKDINKIIPVVYQPAIDSWNNFVREIHCHKINEKEFEVSILFNNEELRRHRILNRVYEWFRSLFYGRTIDIETFKIILNNGVPSEFKFSNIYSGEFNQLEQDTVHEEKAWGDEETPLHKIKYYYANYNHPIVFINTSNHAMAEHDNNHRLWKWEYVAWEKNSPVVYGEKSRQEIEDLFKSRIRFGRVD